MKRTSSKRANGEGTICKRSDGKGWSGAVTIGYDAQGKQIRRYFSGKTQQEVREKLQAALKERDRGTLVPRTDLSVSEFLDQWLDLKQRSVREKTWVSYELNVRKHLKPVLGGVKLDKLTALSIERYISTALEQGTGDKVIARALGVLKLALKQAVTWGLVGVNVAERVKAPKYQRVEMHVWTPEEAQRFLDVNREHRLYPLFYTALTTGMRRGELLGLHWRDVDLERGELRVKHSLVQCRGKAVLSAPKTETSVRRVTLSADTVQVLAAHRAVSRGEIVFESTAGTYILPPVLLRQFAKLCKAAGVPRIRLHDLRHTHASLLIAQNVPIKAVAERLGHRDPSLTLKVYTHVYDDQRREAAMPLDMLLSSAHRAATLN